MILEKILQHKRFEVELEMQQTPMVNIESLAEKSPPARPFATALKQPDQMTIIAEVKRRSPSKGLLCPNFNYLALAKDYYSAGAAAISVLTDKEFFGGHPRFLEEISKLSLLPVLRKDFIIHPYQVYQSRALGADAILLIVAALDDYTLAELHTLTEKLGMAALVEVHDAVEMSRALAVGAKIIGINNRDLKNFCTDINTTLNLRQLINDPGITVVSESGIQNSEDMAKLANQHVHSVLIGETLVTAANVNQIIKQLLTGGVYCD